MIYKYTLILFLSKTKIRNFSRGGGGHLTIFKFYFLIWLLKYDRKNDKL